MGKLGSLAKDTAIYGLSSIVGRFLNYLLVPLYTAKLAAASGGYGVITEVYSYVALLLVLLTFGMETTFFRFVNKEGENPKQVYANTLIAVGGVALLFAVAVLALIGPISTAMGYAEHPEFIGMMAVCVAIDAFQCVPFAYLRYQRRPIKFAALKLLFIVMNIALNVLFFVVLNRADVFYAFAINLACTASITFLFLPELTAVKWRLDRALLRRMLKYSWPILVLGIAGILNQTVDKMIFPHLIGGHEGKVQLGIYGACVKIAMIMAMITQAFRYAYEPFVFAGQKNRDSRETYAKAMKYFIIFTLLAFLMVMGYIDVVPIVMAAEIMMGVYFNLSFWYKLIDKTIWGAWFSGAGCVTLIAVNVIFIPHFGYMACAWAGVAGYGTAMVLSYVVGQRHYPIAYPLKSIGIYVLLAAAAYTAMSLLPQDWPKAARLGLNTVIIALFIGYIVKKDLPLSGLPIVGKYFR